VNNNNKNFIKVKENMQHSPKPIENKVVPSHITNSANTTSKTRGAGFAPLQHYDYEDLGSSRKFYEQVL
jgi:hypothetical protein